MLYINDVDLAHADHDKMYEYLIITRCICTHVCLYTYTFVCNMIRYLRVYSRLYHVFPCTYNQPFQIYIPIVSSRLPEIKHK